MGRNGIKKLRIGLVPLLLLVLSLAATGCFDKPEEATPRPSLTATVSPAPALAPISIPTLTPTPMPTVTPTAWPTVLPADTDGADLPPTPTSTHTPSPTPAHTPTPTTIPTQTPTPTPKATPTPAPTLAPTPTTPPGQEVAEVVRVIDGDTVELLGDERLRYIGIDTPERGDCYYQEATDKNVQLVEGKTVILEKDVSETDMYGRLLRYVYVDDLFVNAELVRLGYAEAYPYPPDTKYAQLFAELEQEATVEGRGMWGACATPTPTSTSILTATPTHTPTDGASDVQIVYIFYDGLVPYVESDEYVAIQNLGSASQNLSEWVLIDISDGGPSFTFPYYVLEPGETIRVYTNEIHPEWGGFSFACGQAIWSNSDPDNAALLDDQGQTVSTKSY